MQKLHIKLKAAYPIVLLLACIIIISSFGISYALGLSKRSDVWTGQASGIAASSTDTYPYSRLLDEGENALDASKIHKVGFDVLYGTTPDGFSSLVQFLGEVPYTETFDNGERAEGWSGYDSYYEGTSLVDTAYWGNTGVSGGSAVDISQLEAVNSEDNIVSLRLYALSVTSGQIGFWIGNFFYSIQIFFAGLGTKLIGLLVIAKNIDMLYILEALGMEELADVVTKSFIGDHETGRISIFAGFCILMFIVSVAGMAISYAKGGTKKIGWKDILVPVFVGIIITGACLAGRITDLGSTLSNLTNEVVYAMAGAITDPDGNGGVFITDVDDETYQNQVVQIQEMSLINKCFVDMQICTQLGVMDISELDINKFGTTNTDILLSNGLYGVSNTSGIGVLNLAVTAADTSTSSVSFSEDFGNNVGYYFWYANSGASCKTHYNQTIPETSPVASERKLTNFVTWMQDTYNNNASNAQVRELLRSMTVSMAAPSTGAGFLRMFLFTGIMIVLFLCLWRYTKDILLAKFQMLVALLGMAIAGPLMFTGKKKLVNTGRDLMALILISFVEITVHSLMFDAIIYGTSIVINPNLFRLIITFFLLLLLWKFNKAINERIKKFTADLEKSMMSSGSMVRDVKQKANTALRKKPHELLAAKSAAYDAANPDQAGGLKSKLLRMAADSTADSSQTKGFGKITMESMKDHKEALKNAAERRLDEAEKAVDDAFKEVETQEATMNQALQAKAEELNEDPTKWSAEARRADQERRKAEEAFKQVSAMKMEREMNSEQFKKNIADELAKNNQVCNAAAVEAKYTEIMKNYDEKLDKLKEQADKQKADFNTALTRQTIEDNKGLSDKQKANLSKYLDDGKTLEEAIKSTAQEACKDNIASAVKTLNKEANEQSNVKIDGARIGAPKVVNERAVATANATNLMMQELEAGLTVDNLDDSKNLMEAVTKATVMQNSFDKNNNSAYVATTELAGDVREMTADMKAKVAEEVQGERGIVRGIANGSANVAAGIANKSASVAGAAGTVVTSGVAAVTEAGRAVARVGAADISVQNAQNANSAVSAILAAKKTGTTDQAVIAAAAKSASDAYQKQKHEKQQKTPVTKEQFVQDENRMTADRGKPQAQPQSPAESRPDIMNATRDDSKPKKKGFFSRDDYE